MNIQATLILLPLFASIFAGCLDAQPPWNSDSGLDFPEVTEATPRSAYPIHDETSGQWFIEHRLENYAHWSGLIPSNESIQLLIEWHPDAGDGYLVVSGAFGHHPESGWGQRGFVPGSFVFSNNEAVSDQGAIWFKGSGEPREVNIFAESFGSTGTLRLSLLWNTASPLLWLPQHQGVAEQLAVKIPYSDEKAQFIGNHSMSHWTSVHMVRPCVLQAGAERPAETLSIDLGTTFPNHRKVEGYSESFGARNMVSHVGFWNYGASHLPVAINYSGPFGNMALLFSDAPWESFVDPGTDFHIISSSSYCTKKPLEGDGNDDDYESEWFP